MPSNSPKEYCCFKLKTWTTFIGVCQLILSALATAEWVLGLVELSTNGTLLDPRNKTLLGVSVVLPIMYAIGFNVGILLVISNFQESLIYLSTWMMLTTVTVVVGVLVETFKSFSQEYYWTILGLLMALIASLSVPVVYFRAQEIKKIRSSLDPNPSQISCRSNNIELCPNIV